MFDKKFVLDFAYWYHNGLFNSERRDVEIELEKFKRMYKKREENTYNYNNSTYE